MDLVLAIMMLTAMGLVAGAYYLWRRGASRLQIALMLVMALVLVANVAIWSLPPPVG
jgi:hypothetical protein